MSVWVGEERLGRCSLDRNTSTRTLRESQAVLGP